MDTLLARKTAGTLSKAGIDFVTYLPETRLSEILPALRQDASFTLVPVSSEAEAVGIAAGAALAGKGAAVYMEGTGLFVSSYNLLTVGVRYGIPLLLLVAYVGSFEDQRNSFLFSHYGTRTEGLLDTLGIQYRILESSEELEARVRGAVRMMHALKQPVALLFTGEFTN
ncbi:MAG TPA: thiamine pyrophosphate-binding protein [Candidatus Eisenbacteria bacterium]|nr:thiamine pyrophosphate-binding protein [Candidatus Eisenbacteria bacterium]